MAHDDGEVLRSATAYLRTLLHVGGSAALGWPGVPDCLAAVLAAVQRLLSPELEDRACSLVGALILELLRNAGPQMAPLLPALLTALAYKLIAAEDSAVVQSLLCVLAQLMHADQQQLLDCLAGIQLSDSCSALEACMHKWCERQIEVRTAYNIRLTMAALAALLTSSHTALNSIRVKGKRLDAESGVRTRARARAQAEQWSSVPLRVRIAMLLTDAAFIEATTQDEASEDEWEEAGGSEEEEQDSEQAGGPSPALSSLPSTMRRFAEAYQEDGGFDAEDLVLSGVDAREAARRAADPLQAIDIPVTVREAFQRVAAARPELMQAGSEQLTPTQLQALQQIFQQQGLAER